MLVSLKWLNEYVKVDDLDPQALADLISLHGVEVESVSKVAEATGIVVGYVEKKEQHPDADKLSVCQVNLGSETVQIVCGAKNVDAGQKVPVATHGAVLPGNFKIKQTKLRGQASNGMICSASELGIAAHHVPAEISEGIWVLPADAPVGADALSYLGLDDTIIELGLTPNRMDMLSLYGVANDVAAIIDREVKPVPRSECIQADADAFRVTFETDKVTSYLAKLVKNVTIKPSTFDLQMKLMATGNKPISNVVDLTNEIMLTSGIPIHAFDADKLPAKEITVREALDGEKVVTLDDQERLLEAGDILITSGGEIVAIAGVMGSASSAIDAQTTNIVFEAAIFNPTQIRKTATRLNLRTNASARFEKGIHIDRLYEADQLINAAFPENTTIKTGVFEAELKIIDISVAEINQKLGTALTADDVTALLTRLNVAFEVKDEVLSVTPSTRMLDVVYKHDLIEEIARIYGFNQLPSTLPAMNATGGYTVDQKRMQTLHQVAQAVGLQNVITYSLTHARQLAQFLRSEVKAEAQVSLSMPLSLDHAHLRMSLIPSLLEVIAYNNARQTKDVFIYEIGKIHTKSNGRYVEKTVISGALSGEQVRSKWQNKVDKVDFYAAKGIVDALLHVLGFEAIYEPVTTAYPDFHPGQTAIVTVDGQMIGVVGKIHPTIKKEYDLNDTFVFELDLEALRCFETTDVNYRRVSKYPGISFDIALLSDDMLPVSALVDTIKQAGSHLLSSVDVFDVYTGVGMPEGKKSVAINLYYQDVHKTLTDEDIRPVHEKVLKQLEQEHGATLRT
ncbi:MAG: phenylalanine--tRNA ligase subunit beta [Defluviitaleaceae bacterium]|nr:phenylalanine--tRNA ligase subunit beta [Defluviitaleaceae bacterium]